MTPIETPPLLRSPGEDPYTDTLDRLLVDTRELEDALFRARISPWNRQDQALAGLHTRVRAMAATLNHALGGWPDDPDSGDPG